MKRTIGCVLACLAITACQKTPGPPVARVVPVVDSYFGAEVADPYRWLEDWDDPAVRRWSDGQNVSARAFLDALPGVEAVREQVTTILSTEASEYSGVAWTGREYLAIATRPPAPQPLLVALPSLDGLTGERVVLDPNLLDPSGATHIDWYAPSPDGRLVAVSLSVGGTESGDVHVWDVETGEPTGEVVPRVNGGTAGGDLSWTPDGSGFYYTRYARPGERPDDELSFHQEIWYHAFGTDTADDRYELGRDMPKIAEWVLASDPASGRVLATYQYGDSGRFQFHLRSPDGDWVRLTAEDDEVSQMVFAPDGALYCVSRLGAPKGRVLRIPPGSVSLAEAEVVVDEGGEVIVSDFGRSAPFTAVGDGLYLTVQLGGPSTIRAFGLDGAPRPGPNVPEIVQVTSVGRGAAGELLFSIVSYTEPKTWFRFDTATGRTDRLAISTPPPVDFSDVEVVRETATSKDGTRVPVMIVRPRGAALDGDRPALLTGYGGFGVSNGPKYRPRWRPWLDRGGVAAVAIIRGGGEFGEDWHRAGMLTNKQNCFDDFAAAMQLLIELGYTRPERLAIEGGSNGGLLMGAMITQHPELARAVVAHVGLYDMLRMELSANGTFNIPEYGTVTNEEQFRAMHAYSPYHRVVDGTAYPAVLMTTGANDPRVDPMQSRKMVARLQAATSSGRPVLLRTSADTGHGGATPLPLKIEEETHALAFLLAELGVTPAE